MNLTNTDKILETITLVCTELSTNPDKANDFKVRLFTPILCRVGPLPRFCEATSGGWCQNISAAALALNSILRTAVCLGQNVLLNPRKVYSPLEPDDRIKTLMDRLYNQLAIDEFNSDDELEFIGCQILLDVYQILVNQPTDGTETPA